MIIGFDAKRAFSNTTGLGVYSRNVIRGIMRGFPQHRCVLFNPTAADAGQFPGAAVVTPSRAFHKKFPWYWRSFHLPVEERNAGLHLYHGLSNELPFGKPAAGVKQVVTIHDIIFIKYPHYYPSADRIIYAMKVRHSCKTADCIVAVSEQTKKDLALWLPGTEEKIKVVYQCCGPQFDEVPAPEKQAAVARKYGLPEKYIFNAGALSERKNLLTLVQSFGLLIKETDAHLVIAGHGGKYKMRLEKMIASLRLGDRVRIISGITDDELPSVYRKAALFVYPSVYEGFGIPVIEALASAVPVITTDGGCFREAGGPHTCYVNTLDVKALADKMMKVLTDEKQREKMIQGGLEHVKQFRMDKTSEKMMELYEKMVPGDAF